MLSRRSIGADLGDPSSDSALLSAFFEGYFALELELDSIGALIVVVLLCFKVHQIKEGKFVIVVESIRNLSVRELAAILTAVEDDFSKKMQFWHAREKVIGAGKYGSQT